MKCKLTVSIEQELVPRAKRSARKQGVSLSWVIEQALTRLVETDSPSFSGKWRGRFQLRSQGAGDPRMRELVEKHLGDTRK